MNEAATAGSPDATRPGAAPNGMLGFATSEDAPSVTALDLGARQAVASFPAAPAAHAMALTPDGARLYVVNRRGRSLLVLDARRPAVITTIPLDSDPMAAAVSPDGRWLAVLARTQLRAWLFDAASGALIHDIDLAAATADILPAASESSGGGPRSTHPIWAPDGQSFYAEDNLHVALLRVDAARGQLRASVPLSSIAHTVYFAAGGARAYALCTGAAERGVPPSVVTIDTTTERVVGDVPIPLARDESGELHHGTFDASGRRLFVANLGQGRPRGGRSVHILDTDSLQLLGRLEAQAGAGHPLLSPDGARLFVVNHSSPLVSVFDAERPRLIAEVALPGARGMGHGAFFTADGSAFWAVSSSAGAAYAIDTQTLAVVAQIPTGPNSQDLIHSWRDAYA